MEYLYAIPVGGEACSEEDPPRWPSTPAEESTVRHLFWTEDKALNQKFSFVCSLNTALIQYLWWVIFLYKEGTADQGGQSQSQGGRSHSQWGNQFSNLSLSECKLYKGRLWLFKICFVHCCVASTLSKTRELDIGCSISICWINEWARSFQTLASTVKEMKLSIGGRWRPRSNWELDVVRFCRLC